MRLLSHFDGTSLVEETGLFAWTAGANSPSVVTVDGGPALQFAGLDLLSSQELADELRGNGDEGLTVAARVKPTLLDTNHRFVTDMGNFTARGLGMAVRENNTRAYAVSIDSFSDSVVSGSWSTIAFSWTPAGDLTVYVNGSKNITATPAHRGWADVGSESFTIGQQAKEAVANRGFVGYLKQLSVWDTVLTDDLINAWFQQFEESGTAFTGIGTRRRLGT